MRLALALLAALLAWPLFSGLAQAQSDGGESVGGAFRMRTEAGAVPVVGVSVSIEAEDGTPVSLASSDPKGAWRVDLPSPGRYRARLDRTTLPRQAALRVDALAELSIEVRRGESAIILFPLVPRDASEAPDAPSLTARLLQTLADGAVFGAVLAIAAIGLSLIYGVARVVNFSHGDLVSFGALLAAFLNASALGPQAPLALAAILAVALLALLGLPFEAMFRSIGSRARDHFTILVFSIGLSFLLRHALLFGFGPFNLAYREYQLQDPYRLGPVLIAPRDAAVFVVAVAVVAAVGLFLTRTRIGWAMRAAAVNPGLAEQCGIAVRRMQQAAWVLGAGLAATGGVLLAVSQQARWDTGYQLLMFMFAAAILGGLGTAFGALVGGLLIGLIVQMSTLAIPPELKPAVAMLVLVATLLVRPSGLLNRARRLG